MSFIDRIVLVLPKFWSPERPAQPPIWPPGGLALVCKGRFTHSKGASFLKRILKARTGGQTQRVSRDPVIRFSARPYGQERVDASVLGS